MAASSKLFDEVIDAGLCTLCGACSGGCPYLLPYKGRIALLDNCMLSEGQCYQYCPRTYTDMNAISSGVFGVPYSNNALGTVRDIFIARSADAGMRKSAQYGGTVTALLSLAILEKIIDVAILSKASGDRIPHAHLARNADEILQCAGSNYMASPTLMQLNKFPRNSEEKLAIVATPCQCLSLAKMKTTPPMNRLSIDNIKLVIGLFCTWALSPDEFSRFLVKNFYLPEVIKFDIPPPPADRLDIYTTSGKVSFPLEQIREYIMPACAYCLDMTAEFADVSVGTVEGRDGWNTVIVRTEAGAEILKLAREKKKLEVEAIPQENLAHLKAAALLKKTRALKFIVQRSGDKKDLLYLGISEELANSLVDRD